MEDLIKECREKINNVVEKKSWLQKHNFQEECRVLQTKIGGMFQIYEMLLDYSEKKQSKQ
jgi:hypothetical protein